MMKSIKYVQVVRLFIKDEKMLLVRSKDNPGRVHNVYVGFMMEYVEGQPQPDEVDGVDFFSLEEMKSMDVADMTRGLARIAFEQQAVGLKLNPLPKKVFNGYTFFNV